MAHHPCEPETWINIKAQNKVYWQKGHSSYSYPLKLEEYTALKEELESTDLSVFTS